MWFKITDWFFGSVIGRTICHFKGHDFYEAWYGDDLLGLTCWRCPEGKVAMEHFTEGLPE